MQFRDLNAQYKKLKDNIDKGIAKVIEGTQFILGPEVTEIERRLAKYVGCNYCVTCASGTDALILALMAWGIGRGDAVFVPDFTYFATVNSEMIRGATPILIDIDKDTFNIETTALEKAIQRVINEGKLVPKVIIPVDLFGQCADYDEIIRIAKKYNLKILEDGAQGFGGKIKDKMACTFGDIGITSFFPAKPLGCYGDGGALFTDDAEVDALLRSLRGQGKSPSDKYDNRRMGLNSRLDTLQAAILIPKLKAFEEYEVTDVNKIAAYYTEKLKKYVKTPFIKEGYVSSWAQYTILLKSSEERDGLKEYLKDKDIPTMVYYPRGMHQQTVIKEYGYDKGRFDNTEYVVQRCLSLPISPYLRKEEQDIIINEIINYIESGEKNVYIKREDNR